MNHKKLQKKNLPFEGKKKSLFAFIFHHLLRMLSSIVLAGIIILITFYAFIKIRHEKWSNKFSQSVSTLKHFCTYFFGRSVCAVFQFSLILLFCGMCFFIIIISNKHRIRSKGKKKIVTAGGRKHLQILHL